jgi:hypothetical protein
MEKAARVASQLTVAAPGRSAGSPRHGSPESLGWQGYSRWQLHDGVFMEVNLKPRGRRKLE